MVSVVKVMLQGEGMEMFVERTLYVRWAAGRCFKANTSVYPVFAMKWQVWRSYLLSQWNELK
jgi:hypothetical protein